MAKYLDSAGLSKAFELIKNAIAGKQDTLVSGTNIKTINNTSLLGSGDIQIGGGGTVPDPLTVAELNVTSEANIIGNLILGDASAGHSEDGVTSSGSRYFDVYDSSGNPVWRFYMSYTGSLARQPWDSSTSSWGAAEYFRFGTIPISAGGTGQTSANAAARALGMAKTAGDSWTMNNLMVGGFLTNAKASTYCSIPIPYRLYGVNSVAVSGSVTIRGNGNYLCGSTSDTPRAISAFTSYTASASANGFIYLRLNHSAQGSGAVNNDPVSLHFNTLTITLR